DGGSVPLPRCASARSEATLPWRTRRRMTADSEKEKAPVPGFTVGSWVKSSNRGFPVHVGSPAVSIGDTSSPLTVRRRRGARTVKSGGPSARLRVVQLPAGNAAYGGNGGQPEGGLTICVCVSCPGPDTFRRT